MRERLTRRALLGTAAGAALAGCRPPHDPHTLRVWSMWAGDEQRYFENTLAAFNRERRPARPLSNLGAVADDKTIRALVGGSPPELFTLRDSAMLAPLAANRALRPLDDLMERSGISLDQFTDASIGQCRWEGQTWAIPYLVDCMVLLWNKKVFRDAGLDPEAPPRTLEELETLCAKLTLRKDGRIQRVGLRPFDPVQLIAACGGRFLDPATGDVTADHPDIVRAARWYRRLMDVQGGNEAVAGFSNGLANEMGSYNPFYLGQAAMVFTGQWYTWWTEKYAPKTDYGIAALPHPADRPDLAGAAWLGGNLFCIPRESRSVDAAWQYLAWTQTPIGQRTFCDEMHGVPNQRESLRDASLRTGAAWKEKFGLFMDLSAGPNARHFPPMPVANLYLTELAAAFDAVRYGRREPEDALAQCRVRVQKELDRYRPRGGGA